MNENEKKMRIAICEKIISELEAVEDSEPRKAEALAHYRKQLEEIKNQPVDIVVQLKPGIITAKGD